MGETGVCQQSDNCNPQYRWFTMSFTQLSLLEEVWVGSPSGRWWNSRDAGSPGIVCAATSAALASHTYREISLGISLRPLLRLILCLWDLCSVSRCADRLCEKRLANIDSSWRRQEIKRKRRRGLSKKEKGNKWCIVLSWMIYAVKKSRCFLGKSVWRPNLCRKQKIWVHM